MKDLISTPTIVSMHGSFVPDHIIRFGVFEVDLREAELRHSGLRLKLSPQAFEVLRAMLERPGELITRDELRERLWPGNTTVNYELGLKKCVNRIRELLGDSADHPQSQSPDPNPPNSQRQPACFPVSQTSKNSIA